MGCWKAFVLNWKLGVTNIPCPQHCCPALSPAPSRSSRPLQTNPNLQAMWFPGTEAQGNPLADGLCKLQPLCPLSLFILEVWNVRTFYGISNKMSKPNLRMSHVLRSKMHQWKANCINTICNVSRLHSLLRYNWILKGRGFFFFQHKAHTEEFYQLISIRWLLPQLFLWIYANFL